MKTKLIVIEARYIGKQFGNYVQDRDWFTFGKYKKDKSAQDALSTLSRNFKNLYEFRIKPQEGN